MGRPIDRLALARACALLGDTVLDPAVWPQVMDEFCEAIGATGAVIFQSDIRTPDIPHTAAMNDLFDYYFKNGWHIRDTRAVRGAPLLLKGANVVTDQDFLTPGEIRRDAFYNEALAPFGFQWFAGVGFYAGPALWALTLQRTPREGPFEEPDKHILASLAQKLTEVASLSTAVGRIALSSGVNALNAVRQPAIAIDRFGFMLDANAAAEAVFDDHIHIKGGRLFVTDVKAKRELSTLCDRLRTTPDTEELKADPIVVRRKDANPIVVHLLPVHGTARTPFLGARALLMLIPVEPKPGPSAALLTQIFTLTPAEAKLTSLIAEGVSPDEAAEQLGISRATARNQLKAVFAKTETHRQSELVALLARL